MKFIRSAFVGTKVIFLTSIFLLSCEEMEPSGVHYLGVVLQDAIVAQKVILLSDGRRIYPLSGIASFSSMEPGTKLKVWCEASDTIQNIIHADVRRYVVSDNEVFYDGEPELSGSYFGWVQHYRISDMVMYDRVEVSATISDESIAIENTESETFPMSNMCSLFRNRGLGEIEFTCALSDPTLGLEGKFEFMRAIRIDESAGISTEYFTLWRKNSDGTFVSIDLAQVKTISEH